MAYIGTCAVAQRFVAKSVPADRSPVGGLKRKLCQSDFRRVAREGDMPAYLSLSQRTYPQSAAAYDFLPEELHRNFITQ